MGRDHYHAPPQRADLPGYGQSFFTHARLFDHSLHHFASVKGRSTVQQPYSHPKCVTGEGAGFEPAKCGHTYQVSKPLGVRGPFGLVPSTKLGHPRAEGWRPDPSPRQGSGSGGHHYQQLPDLLQGLPVVSQREPASAGRLLFSQIPSEILRGRRGYAVRPCVAWHQPDPLHHQFIRHLLEPLQGVQP